jgi:hypothetical protein
LAKVARMVEEDRKWKQKRQRKEELIVRERLEGKLMYIPMVKPNIT